MRARGPIGFVVAAIALLVALPAAATARGGGDGPQTAVVGSHCSADDSQVFGEGTILPTEVADEAGSATAPFDGVITSWTVNIGYKTQPFPQRLFVAAMTGIAPMGEAWAMLGPGPTETVKTGLNTFPAQIPIISGETIALSSVGTQGSPLCETGNSDDVSATSATGLNTGDQGSFLQTEGEQIPGTATVESDSDGDGYGDVSQDACPRSKRVHSACPRIQLDAHAAAGKRSARVVVAASTRASVTVEGTARVPGSRSKTTVQLRSVSKKVSGGTLGRFKLRHPPRLKRLLRTLPADRKVKIRTTASATDKAGVETVAEAKARIRGRAPRR